MKHCQTDILVIGGGASGLSAAAAALEKGAVVTIMECNKGVGGNGVFPRGIFAVDSVIQRRKLVFADKDEMFAACMAYSHWKTDGRIVRRLIDKTGETIDWLMEKGVPFTDVAHHLPNQMPEVFHITAEKEPVGRTVMRALENFCREHGAEILTSVRGQKLLQEETGAVCGAVGVREDGEEISVRARKVIICTGGFAGNREMIREYLPELHQEELTATTGFGHMGEGIRMARAAGAEIEGHFTMEIAAPRIAKYEPLNILIGKPYNVWVNCFGKRFADEGIVYNFPQSANACMRQPGSQMWVLFDQTMMERTLRDGMDVIEAVHIPERAAQLLDTAMEAAERDRILCSSDSLEGLAEFIGCDRDTFLQSVAEYNMFCGQGRDALFAKYPGWMIPLGNGPFYAIKAGTALLNTHGGVRVDENFRALRSNYEPLGNLYVAGVDFGGVDADIYNVTMSGHGFSFAVNSGRIAGEHAAQEIVRTPVIYTVKKIEEDMDYGCEERAENMPVMAEVTLQEENGIEHRVKMPDQMLYDRKINEGDTVCMDAEHMLSKK